MTYSRAHATIVESWLSNPVFQMNVPPTIPTSNIGKFLAKSIDPNNLEVGLLRIERLWVDEKLKDVELLDALCEAFKFLSNLLFEAHKSLLKIKQYNNCKWFSKLSIHKDILPDGLRAQQWDRNVWINLHTKKPRS